MSPGQAVFAGMMIIMVMNMVPVTPVACEPRVNTPAINTVVSFTVVLLLR
jgi:hypothetical protein